MTLTDALNLGAQAGAVLVGFVLVVGTAAVALIVLAGAVAIVADRLAAQKDRRA